MWDLRRLRGTLIAVASALAAMAVPAVVATAALGGRPGWLPADDSPMDAINFNSTGRRVAGVLREGRAPGRLGILLGSSAMQCSIDPTRLGPPPDGRPIRWLELASTGANGLDVLDLTRFILRGGLRPEVVVVVLSPESFAHTTVFHDDPTSVDPSEFIGHLRSRNLGLALKDLDRLLLAPLNRAMPNRTRIGHKLKHLAVDARLAVLEAAGLGFQAAFAPLDDPWVEPDWVTLLHPPQFEPERARKQLKFSATKGWFDPACYAVDGAGIMALMEAIRTWRGIGAEVMLVFPPEGAPLREVVPPEARTVLRRALRESFGEAAPAIYDLSDAVEDRYFEDLLHVDPVGRRIYTERLSRTFRDAGLGGRDTAAAPAAR